MEESVMSAEPSLTRITMQFEDLEALEEELESNLRSGRAFVRRASGVAERQRCELVLVHPSSGSSLCFQAEVVWVRREDPGAGVGLQLEGFDAAALQRLETFVAADKSETDAGADEPDNLYTRVRRYSTAEQLRAAREADYSERVALERVYGKAVWEVLLHNPRVTAPEVTRIARNRKLPKQLADTITSNLGWLGSSELRRSLLMNPQVVGGSLERVLRAMPKLELTRISKQSSYPLAVREAAKKMQKR
jgi:hypothetical protein